MNMEDLEKDTLMNSDENKKKKKSSLNVIHDGII
jgi:hypothetical protein